MIGIINYGSGNIAALMNIFKQRKLPYMLCSQPSELKDASRFLLPGVGAFDPTMDQLHMSGMLEALGEQVFIKEKPVLGICVGMHLLAESSEEGQSPGLGWIKGCVRKIDISNLKTKPHLPHMGWNSIDVQKRSRLFEGIDLAQGFYFLHSYYFDAELSDEITANVQYGVNLPCAVGKGLVHGVQFHPEKSHSNGLKLLQNFSELN
jgi:imidazole glycerol-phosphate synthase subunit HisH